MVWDGISHRARIDLVTVHWNLNAMRYCNKIVQPALLTFLRQGHATIFQEDNARCHVARHTMDFLQANNVIVLDWPARSPDMSPIEHLWDHLGRRVRERNDVNNVRDLERVLHEEWTRIPMAVVRRLISSTRRRCGAVIDSNGGHTRYWSLVWFSVRYPNVVWRYAADVLCVNFKSNFWIFMAKSVNIDI